MTIDELTAIESYLLDKLAGIRTKLAAAREDMRATAAATFIAEHGLTLEMIEPEPPRGMTMVAYYELLDAQPTVKPFAGFGGRVYQFDAGRNLTETGVRLSDLVKPTKSADSQAD